jgi:twinkle protein
MIVSAMQRQAEFHKLRTETAFRQTYSTGYDSLDEIIKLSKGYLAVVSGFPGSGKSEWLDAVMVNAALLHKWKTLFFSPENFPIQEHIAKLAEKLVGKWIRQFSDEETERALKFLNLHFAWLDIDKEFPTLDQIFSRAQERKNTLGLDALVIDPWNGVRHLGNFQQREDQYLADVLTQCSYFARRNELFMAIVAHPKTIPKGKDGKLPRCAVSDISGGSMWWNKVDYAFICHREDRTKNQIEVDVVKIKQKWQGTIGSRFLDYDRRTGRFKDTVAKEFLLPTQTPAPF